MARVGGLPLPTITDDRVLGESVIQRSLRFNRSSHYLSRALGSPTSDDKASVSVWLKRIAVGTDNSFFDNYQGTNDRLTISLVSSTDGDALGVYQRDSSGIVCNLLTTQKFRDPASWYHILVAFDTTQSTEADRVKIYVNGTQVTSFSSSTYFSQNHNLRAGSGYTTNVGRYGAGSNYFGGYMAEFNYIDGQQLSPTDVGFTDSQTGIWMPRRYEGTYGNNGFRLDFSDNSSTAALGIDKSPNGNDFTTNNFSVTAGSGNDSFIDTPTNNFCTLNHLDKTNDADVQNGGMTLYNNANDQAATGTFGITSGKWYWEVVMNSNEPEIGIAHFKMPLSNKSVSVAGDGQIALIVTGADGNSNFLRVNGSTTSGSGISGQSGPGTIGIALDMDNKKIWFTNTSGNYFNSGNPVTGNNPAVDFSSTGHYPAGVTPFVSLYQGANIQTSVNFGQYSFSYTQPEGYKTLTSQNLRDHLITSNTPILNPKEHFAAITYSGAQSSTNATGLLFEPDMIWIKSRTQLYNHYIFDRLRGLDGSHLIPNSNAAEGPSGSDATALGGTHASGFFVSSASGISDSYQAPNNYVAWCWKAGGAAVTNNDGNTTSQVSVNREAGFSIVTYAGTGQPRTIGHGLGKKPAWIMSKSRDSTDDWMVWHQNIHTSNIGNYSIALNSTGGRDNASQYWYDSEPTSTVFTRGNYSSGDDMIAYCWAEIPGYSKFGNYTGNGNSNGPFIHLGFRPAWFMLRRVDSGDNWIVKDSARNTTNDVYFNLNPNSNGVQNGSAGNVTTADFVSNGFKLRGSDSGVNSNGADFVFMAFAEQSGISPYSTIRNAR